MARVGRRQRCHRVQYAGSGNDQTGTHLAFSQKLPIHAHGELMQNLIQSKGNH